MPKGSKLSITKSRAVKREEKKNGPSAVKHYKIKIKGTDPQMRSGNYSESSMKQITEKKANKLYKKAANIRKDVENIGQKTFGTLARRRGLTEGERIGGSQISSGKSNLNLKGKLVKLVAGKEAVAKAEAKNPGNQYEKGTKGYQTFVATKDPTSSNAIQPKFRPTETSAPSIKTLKKKGK